MATTPVQATLEIYRSGRWQAAATFTPHTPAQGYRGSGDFEYLLDYAVLQAGPDQTAPAAVSCRYPVDFDLHPSAPWPAFLLDILPNGYGRQQWLEQLELADGPSADWPLLLRGTAFPPGNLRIAEAVAAKDLSRLAPTAQGDLVAMSDHPGFDEGAVLSRNEYFLEYAVQHGIYAAGASDVQGAAPKLLLTQNLNGKWHAEGALPDSKITASWILKRPRGRSEADKQVLRNEAAYMRVARKLGLSVHASLHWENDTLLIPRFDRCLNSDNSVTRLGMESLCSLAGIAEYRAAISQDVLCTALLRYSSDPAADLLEFIQRDIANVVLGNKDNHARNSAVLKWEDGTVRLSPLFDFAPMYLDPEGIARVCRWEGDAEVAGTPNWAILCERYQEVAPNILEILKHFGKHIERLPDIMREAGVDDSVIEQRTAAINQHSKQLKALA